MGLVIVDAELKLATIAALGLLPGEDVRHAYFGLCAAVERGGLPGGEREGLRVAAIALLWVCHDLEHGIAVVLEPQAAAVLIGGEL